jgi:hypothetical protein
MLILSPALTVVASLGQSILGGLIGAVAGGVITGAVAIWVAKSQVKAGSDQQQQEHEAQVQRDEVARRRAFQDRAAGVLTPILELLEQTQPEETIERHSDSDGEARLSRDVVRVERAIMERSWQLQLVRRRAPL